MIPATVKLDFSGFTMDPTFTSLHCETWTSKSSCLMSLQYQNSLQLLKKTTYPVFVGLIASNLKYDEISLSSLISNLHQIRLNGST